MPSHTEVRGNEQSDLEAKRALTLNRHINTIPYSDLHQYTKRYSTKKWQELWDDSQSKLKEVKPSVGPWPIFTKRRDNTVITRLRIGHTNLTHSYLMSRGRPPEHPECCNVRLTVRHLLLECNKTEELRKKHRLPNDIKRLLGQECPKDRLFAFLTEANLLDKI